MAKTAQIPTIAPLTGIRVLAAIFVFNAHVRPPTGPDSVLASVSLAGHDWMTMFFVLSGLVLTWNYAAVLEGPDSRKGLRSYYVARFARIYPLYLFALLIAVAVLMVSGGGLAVLSNPQLLLHVFALQSWSPDLGVAYGYNGPGWSVGVELFLYALFPLLLIPFRRIQNSPRALAIVAGLCVAVVVALTAALILAGNADLPREDPWSAHRWLYRTPVTRLFDFVLGMSIGYLLLATRGRDFVRLGRLAQVVGAVLVFVPMMIPAVSSSVWSLDASNMAPFALLLLGLAWAPQTAAARFLATPAMVFFGECTYAFYLLHQIIINAIGQPAEGLLPWLSTWGLAFVLTTAAAVAAHLLVERPARSGIRRLLDPRRTSAPSPTPPG